MFDIFDLFNDSDFFEAPSAYREETRCPLCGRTYSDFKKTGKLGCSQCYEVFSTPLSAVLRQIHQNPIHTGKIPASMRIRLSKKRMLDDLQTQLKEAVRNEDYETAAKLHKEIRDIEKG